MSLQFTIYILIELFVICLGHPVDDSKYAKILKFEHEDFGKGPYRYGFESSDGIIKEESGEIHYPGTDHEFMKVVGMFTYPGPDGVMYEVRYTADDQGFHPEGDHIKVPPFVPWIHHPHPDDNNDITDSETGEQNSDVIVTTPKPNNDYLSSSISSTTYLPPRGTTPKNEYTTVGLISPPITSGSNLVSATKPQNLFGENSLDGTPNIQLISEGSFPAANIVNVPSQSEYQKSEGMRSFPSPNIQIITEGDEVTAPTPSVTIQPVQGIKVDLSDESAPKLFKIIENHLLSTPRPNPEINFHSTAESQTHLKFATPKPNRFMSSLRKSKIISKKMVIVAAKK